MYRVYAKMPIYEKTVEGMNLLSHGMGGKYFKDMVIPLGSVTFSLKSAFHRKISDCERFNCNNDKP